MEKYGVPVNVYGKEIWFRPMEIGGKHGIAKADALDAYIRLEESEDSSEMALSPTRREAFIKFAATLLVQNYGQEEAERIASELPVPIMGSIFSIAWTGREDENFMMAGGQSPGSPDEKPNE